MTPSSPLLPFSAERSSARAAIARLGLDQVQLHRKEARGSATTASVSSPDIALSFLLHSNGLSSSWFVYRAGAPLLQLVPSRRGATFLDGGGAVIGRLQRRWRPIRWIAPWYPKRSTFRTVAQCIDHDRDGCKGQLGSQEWAITRRIEDYRLASPNKVLPLEVAAILAFTLLLADA